MEAIETQQALHDIRKVLTYLTEAEGMLKKLTDLGAELIILERQVEDRRRELGLLRRGNV